MANVDYSEDGKIQIKAFSSCSSLKEPIIVNDMFVRLPPKYEGGYSIPYGIKRIIGGAFYDCSFLTSIKIPDSVTEIGARAFDGCSSLTSIDIPDSVTEIGERAFDYCSSLKEPIIVNDMFVRLPPKYEGSYSIPYGIKRIVGGAFCHFSSLTSIEIPDSVTAIEENAFADCSSLTSIEIPDSVTVIEEYAFAECRSLTSIEIPDSVTVIGKYAFFWCSSLTSIKIPHSIERIPSCCFKDTRLKNYCIHEKIKDIHASAFNYCPIEYYSVSERNSFFTQDDGVLLDKKKSKLVRFPSAKVSETYRVPATVEVLGEWAFQSSRLRCLYLPVTIRYFEPYSFANSSSLSEIHIRVKDPYSITVDAKAFDDFDISQCTLYVPIGKGYAYRHHPVFGKFKEIIIER